MRLSKETNLCLYSCVGFVVIVILAAIVRLPGCFSDLWLDEIWTLLGSSKLNSAAEIFTRFRYDNNHHLNTLIMFLLGDQRSWGVYRIHSLISGIGAVILAWTIARRRGMLEGIFASLLMAGSYLMIYFSSEARGYAMVVFFGLVTFVVLRRFVEKNGWLNALMFWVCVCLGFGSHLTYLNVFIASAAWLLVELFRTCEKKRDVIVPFLQCFGVPTAFLICFYVFIIRNLAIGGGPDYKLYDMLVKTLSYAAGGTAAGPVGVITGAVALGFFLWAIIYLQRKGRSEWVFYLFVIFLSPIVILAVKRYPVMFVRYFLLSIAFGLMAVSYLLAGLYRKGGVARICVAVAVVLFLVGNGVHVERFFRYGRGQYLEAMRYIAAQTEGREITISSDHDFRNGVLIEYYKRYLAPEKTITYISKAGLKTGQHPMWVILHRIGEATGIGPEITDRHGNRYELVKALPYAGPSGCHWFLYQKRKYLGLGAHKLNKRSQ
ncbi:MAG: glycosyltransferase family 39 protein [Desulfobacteraceae bacterium]|nr:glycosyltransferase family 39 protein [Desulfobacteraceae bacterium]